MSYKCLLMVLCECACDNLVSKANFNLINRTDLLICLHIIFQISLKHSKGQKASESFWVFGRNFCSAYIDNIHFEPIVHRIYPAELKLHKANASDTEAAFLDINLSIHDDIVST